MASTLGIYRISTEDNQTTIAAATINYPSTVSKVKRMLREGKHPNESLQEMFNTLGEESFTFKMVEKIEGTPEEIESQIPTWEKLFEDEGHTIIGKESTPKPTPEPEEKETPEEAETTEAPKKVNGNKGRKLSEDTKAKISAALTGEKNPFYGVKHSEEARRKMSEGVKKSWEARRAKAAALKEAQENRQEAE